MTQSTDTPRPDPRLQDEPPGRWYQCPGCWSVSKNPMTADGYECGCGERLFIIDLRDTESPPFLAHTPALREARTIVSIARGRVDALLAGQVSAVVYQRLTEDLDAVRAALDSIEGVSRPTHGRHCPCSACAREDWTNPNLAPCGMHGPSCPPIYAPLAAASPSREGAGLDVETVAMALCEQDDAEPGETPALWHMVSERRQEQYRERARRFIAEYARLAAEEQR